MAKSDVESKVYTEYNEQFQVIAWMILLLLLVEMLILDRKIHYLKTFGCFLISNNVYVKVNIYYSLCCYPSLGTFAQKLSVIISVKAIVF